MCTFVQVLSQGFKQHLGWCKGRREKSHTKLGAEGEEGAEGNEEDGEDQGNSQELAAIEASKVPEPPFPAWWTALQVASLRHS